MNFSSVFYVSSMWKKMMNTDLLKITIMSLSCHERKRLLRLRYFHIPSSTENNFIYLSIRRK